MADPTSGAASGRPVILLVDDEDDIRESLKALFETCLDGVDVLVAASGPEALALLERERVDLLISDYKMPAMNGLDLLMRARQKAPDVPRILVTAFPELDIAIRAINEARVENFFTKPFEPEAVLTVVQSLLHEQRLQRLRERAYAPPASALRDVGVRP